ncbi:hypothetical protein M9458_055608, partial [Cirrhinus mrigala]
RRRPRLRDRPLTPAGDLRSVPDAGNPEVEEIALWGMTTPTSPLPVEGREPLCTQMLLSAYGPEVPSRAMPCLLGSGLRLDLASAGTREEDFSPGRFTFWDQLPHRGHVGQRSLDSPRDQAGDLASASQPLAVVDSDGTSWLCDSVRQAPPRYRGVLSTLVHSDTQAAVLRAEVAVLLAKDAIEPVPPAEMKSGFYSPYFIMPKNSGGLRPILDLRALNRSLLRLPFKMLTTKRMLTCIRRQDWFAAIDLKDAYFHVSILPRHRPFLRTKCFHLACPSPRVFTKVTEAALSPLWQMGIRILNYLDDWLLIAHSDLVLRHLSHLGLQVNMTARLTNERAQSVLNCLNSFRHKTAVPLKTFQRLLGHMAAAAAVTPLGLLHMRPLQRWLHD